MNEEEEDLKLMRKINLTRTLEKEKKLPKLAKGGIVSKEFADKLDQQWDCEIPYTKKYPTEEEAKKYIEYLKTLKGYELMAQIKFKEDEKSE